MKKAVIIVFCISILVAVSLYAQQALFSSVTGRLTMNNILIPDPAVQDCYAAAQCADLNGDGMVNETDILGFFAKSGACAPAPDYLRMIDFDGNGCVEFCTGMPGAVPEGENDCTKTNPSRDYSCMFEWLGKRTSCNRIIG